MKGRETVACAAALAGAALLVCCEDKELAAEIAAQKADIITLEADVATAQRFAVDPPEGDPEEELKEAEAQLAATQEEIQELELQLEALRAERAAVEEEFEAYQRKYPIDN